MPDVEQYQSALTGPQMDQALLDMANQTSERYAKGTANGQAVAPGTTGYDDNALYYKDQAAAQVSLAQAAAADAANSAQRAESAVPAGTDAAILWTRDQSNELTADDKAVARKNIMAGGSNRNLLDNPWWGSWGCINQRGFSTVTDPAEQYTIDRWKAFKGSGTAGTITILSSNVIQFNNSSGTTSLYFRQLIPNDLDLTGKTITVSIKLSNGTIYSGSGTVPAKTTIYQSVVLLNIGSNSTFSFTVVPSSISTARYLAQADIAAGANIGISAVKLELGSVSTLANDAPPLKKQELIICKDYFRRLQNSYNGLANFLNGYVTSPSTCEFINVLGGESMRATPTIAVNGTFTINGNNVASWAVINTGTTLNLRAIMSGNVLTTGAAASLIASQYAYIDLSADL